MAEALLIANTRCQVTIRPPSGTQPDWPPDEMVLDLRHVHTHNDVAEACGTFTLVVAPRAGATRTPDAAIPLGSLVTIEFFSPASPQMAQKDRVVMVGRTERHHVTLDYSQRQVRRQVTLSGRSVASALLTATWYHAAFTKDPASGTLSAQSQHFNLAQLAGLVGKHQNPIDGVTAVLHYLLGLPSQRAVITDTSPAESVPQAQGSSVPPAAQQGPTTQGYAMQQETQRLMAANPTLTLQHARSLAYAKTWREAQNHPDTQPMPGTGGRVLATRPVPARVQAQPPAQVPASTPALAQPTPPATPEEFGAPKQLVHWQIPGVELADVLDINNGDEQWSLFEAGVKVPTPAQIGQTNTVWNMLHAFIDPAFQEFFTRMQDGKCKIFFRVKPFHQHEVTTGSRFVPDHATLTTLTCGPGSLLHADLERTAIPVKNIFRVVPLGASALLSSPSFVYQAIPTILTDPAHPSNVLRWGPHPLDHKSPYLSGAQTLPTTPQTEQDSWTVEAAKRWGKILAAWHGWTPEMMVGTVVLLGSPVWNVGHRFLYDDGQGDPWEAYIEGVDHDYSYDPASQSGRYLSQLRLTRIWTLSGAVDHRPTDAAGGVAEEAAPSDPAEAQREAIRADATAAFDAAQRNQNGGR